MTTKHVASDVIPEAHELGTLTAMAGASNEAGSGTLRRVSS